MTYFNLFNIEAVNYSGVNYFFYPKYVTSNRVFPDSLIYVGTVSHFVSSLLKCGSPLNPKNLLKKATEFLKFDFYYKAPYSPINLSSYVNPITFYVSLCDPSLSKIFTPPLRAAATTDL